jgi:DNA-binding CsgD family transcriptional regulator
MAPSEDKVLTLVDQIYDAAGDPALWPQFLEGFANAVGGTGTAIVYHDLKERRGNVDATSRFDPDYQRLYNSHYIRLDAWRDAWLGRFRRASSEWITTSDELVSTDQLRKTEFFNDYLLPQDTVYQFGGPIVISDWRWSSVITCLRPRKDGPFADKEVDVLRVLFPHRQRAMSFRRQMAALEGQQRACFDAMDLLPTGVILLDAKGRILAVNRTASQIFRQNDGLNMDKDGLRASTPSETRQLRSTIASVCDCDRSGLASGGHLRIRRPSGGRPFALMVMRAPHHSFAPDAGASAGIVFITDPEAKVQTSSERVAQIYGLTEAEARLAQLLMNGETLVRAADVLGISHNTARTHLHRIYGKTDTRHQGDLVRLLLSSTAVLMAQNE